VVTLQRPGARPWLVRATRIGPNKASRAANKASSGKPFVYDELVARMRAVLRRSTGPRHPRLAVCDLEIDLASRVVTVSGEPVQLSAKEYELLVALAEDPERVFKKEELLRNVWGFGSLGGTCTPGVG
jgi:DNA-binding response OmpR family regulator